MNRKQRQKSYRKDTKEELEEKLKELKFKMVQTKGIVEKTGFKPEHINKFKKEVAKIKTELNSRTN